MRALQPFSRTIRSDIRADQRGMSAVEFAMIAPVLMIAVMGLMDLGHTMYTNSLLQGAIQKAARDSTIEGAASNTGTLDARVTTMVRNLAPNATLTFQRTNYSSFSEVAAPEDFSDDMVVNGRCDGGEAFEDANGNGVWDADRGVGGVGGARDAVLYSVTVSYTRVFPVARLLGQSNTNTMTANTVLRNQPYSQTAARPVQSLNCP